MKFFVPLRIHLFPFLQAVEAILLASDPVFGSVKPHAPTSFPDASPGNHFLIWSLLPNFKRWLVHNELCAANDNPIDGSILDISSITATYSW